MFDTLALILAILVAFRVSVFLIKEDGPWYIARKLRESVGIIHDEDGNHIAVPDTNGAKALNCIWCLSVWVAPIAMVLVLFVPAVAWILAISAGTIVISELIDHG